MAAAGQDGEVWLAPTRPDCPAAPTAGEWFVPSIWVTCYTGIEMTLAGALGGCSDTISPIWDSTCSLYPCPDEVATDTCLAGFDLPTVTLHFESVPTADRGRISVTGHFDDPNANACTAMGGPLAPLSVFGCRRHFVVTSYRVDG